AIYSQPQHLVSALKRSAKHWWGGAFRGGGSGSRSTWRCRGIQPATRRSRWCGPTSTTAVIKKQGRKAALGGQEADEHSACASHGFGTATRRRRGDPAAARLAGHLGQEIPPAYQGRRTGRRRHRRHLAARGACTVRSGN